jgi:hypothetical protein
MLYLGQSMIGSSFYPQAMVDGSVLPPDHRFRLQQSSA